MNNFVDIFENITANARAEYDVLNKRPFSLYGHPIEIFGILSKKSQSQTFKYDKYPLIALFQDFKEERNNSQVLVKDITIVIMTQTSIDFKAPNRYTNTFKPVLLPVYELFMKHLKRSKYVASDNAYQHTKIDRLYWGKEDVFGNSGNIGNDALDAVVISGLDLRIVNCKII